MMKADLEWWSVEFCMMTRHNKYDENRLMYYDNQPMYDDSHRCMMINPFYMMINRKCMIDTPPNNDDMP